ncbi:MAG: bifunctional riboflavin kinase/FAD synthetase [Peptoniphilus sp.]|nr:bifunctional riboflavin kinase/FAD synthetase [Peptoniphilus sp.]MDD7362980.1 bifunctional riboflavin kinase/FAD synthetase [Bacillota bacterium]MDY6044220.1 bifunctional riboflavin kinase/FAD synthetase [Peptoniphilus sp.]
MEIVEVDLESEISRETAIALGNFDGIHRGHQTLLKEVVEMSKRLGCRSSVLLFKNHTNNLTEGISQELLMSQSQKREILESAGIDIVYEMNFDEEIMRLSPEAFVAEFLAEHLKVKGIVVGYDYRFGFKARGNVDTLKMYCRQSNMDLVVKDAVTYEGHAISSTNIRRAIKDGRPDVAATLLGRPFSIRGTVVRGKQLGRKIGIPTANLLFNTHYVAPKFGVYFARVLVDGTCYYAATNVGTNPTFDEREIKVESYLYDYDGGELYGKTIDVELLRFIRPEVSFQGVEELKARMDEDLALIYRGIREEEFTK